jgi:cytochrome subunit of sulfide dehydrogenase
MTLRRLAGTAALAAALASGPEAMAEAPAAAALAEPCGLCHGIGGQSHGSIPSLAGYDAAALVDLLRGFRSGQIEGTVMNRIARGYSDAEIDAVAQYLAGLGG